MPHRRTPRRFFTAGIVLLAVYVLTYVVYYAVLPLRTPPVGLSVWAASVGGTVIQASLFFGSLCLVASWVMDYLAGKIESLGAAPDVPPDSVHAIAGTDADE